jgi:hypothetical protein
VPPYFESYIELEKDRESTHPGHATADKQTPKLLQFLPRKAVLQQRSSGMQNQ